MKLHIDDYELCHMIVDRFARYAKILEETTVNLGKPLYGMILIPLIIMRLHFSSFCSERICPTEY